jgi:hypothetical protein
MVKSKKTKESLYDVVIYDLERAKSVAIKVTKPGWVNLAFFEGYNEDGPREIGTAMIEIPDLINLLRSCLNAEIKGNTPLEPKVVPIPNHEILPGKAFTNGDSKPLSES